MKNSVWALLRLFFVLKGIQLAIVYFTPAQFDTSSQLNQHHLHSPYGRVVTRILNKLAAWDAVYFNDLFVNGISYEHQFVFCPAWIKLVEILVPSRASYYQAQLWSTLISNLCHLASCIMLYLVTTDVFRNDKVIAHRVALMMIISPAGIFLTANYSENLSNLLTITAIYCYYLSMDFQDIRTRSNQSIKSVALYIMSGVLIALNYTVRANGLLMGVIYVFDLYHFLILDSNFSESLVTIFTGSLLAATLLAQNMYHYFLFCPQRQGWCNHTVPSLFRFAQSHYWNNGFLAYWSRNNIPNFLLAGPVIAWNIFSIKQIYNILPQYKKLASITAINFILTVLAIFFLNVQIVNRVTSFSPLLYWVAALNYQRWWFKYVLSYLVAWNLLQTGLFAAFLPPA
ncbi:uncharacterized protein LODBEIA_P27410 [Lodderomyces beijingensis]|uniref:GPI mannosyltransferase 2 n=1 Tax=Lodderomyces beijingensis TaxID=1775926 RepID=A0ABP0ZK35_9ASCO